MWIGQDWGVQGDRIDTVFGHVLLNRALRRLCRTQHFFCFVYGIRRESADQSPSIHSKLLLHIVEQVACYVTFPFSVLPTPTLRFLTPGVLFVVPQIGFR